MAERMGHRKSIGCTGKSPNGNDRNRGAVSVFPIFLLMVIAVPAGIAQTLNNSGQINNSGTIRVKSQAMGLPPTVNGIFEYFGGDQPVAARQYNDLILSGTGTKTMTAGAVSINDTLFIIPGVTLVTVPGFDLDLDGILTEQGYLQGGVRKTVDLSGSTTSSAFGNIGATISWMGTPPGTTTITRRTDIASTGSGNQSILRYFDVAPTFPTGLNGTLFFKYHDSELNGKNPATLELWRSTDNGSTWRRQGGTVDTAQKTISKTGILGFSRWTASDPSNLLGPPAYEWVASTLAMSSGNFQSASPSTVLTPFVMTVTDFFGNPIQGVTITFAIDSIPSGATGQSLSVTTTATGPGGQASTVLTLGNRPGGYKVRATSAGLSGSPYMLTATAISTAAAMAQVSGDGQSDTVRSTLSPFSVRMADAGSNPVPGIDVAFAVTSIPTSAAGTLLSDTLVTTDAFGIASTSLTLGTKTGTYSVLATTAALPGIQIGFNATATHGLAAILAGASGDGQSGPAGSLLPQSFGVSVTDAFGNPVDGATVQFAVTSVPAGASGQALSATSVLTDSLGLAATRLRLGNYPGTYVTSATVSGLPSVQFTANASFIIADVNNDFDVNIADLTSIIDHILERRILAGIDSVKADVNRDGAINVVDVITIRNALLAISPLVKTDNTQPGEIPSMTVETRASMPNISGELEVTPLGLRFNLRNDVPVKGVQLVIALNTVATVNRTDVVFKRAKQMQFSVSSQAQNIRMVAYNLQNLPIDTGAGSIVRLPLKLADTTLVDSVYAIISAADTTFDVAVRIQVAKAETVYPMNFRLYQNYPNPFNAQTTIEFEVPDVEGRFARALVQVFNLLGEKVKTLARGEHSAGRYVVTWEGTGDDGQKLPSGVYFYRLVSRDYVSAKKMVMLK